MKTKTKNILTLVSGLLLLAAWGVYLITPGSLMTDVFLLAATFTAGTPIALKAIGALRWKTFSIDLLVTIAVTGALIIGEYTESAVVTFLFLFGDFLEGRTLQKTRASLSSLMDMAPLEAVVLRNGARKTIPAGEVLAGERVIVQPGSKIPVDGVIATGQTTINEAAITGESAPVYKKEGDHVYSSTISDNGYLEVIAEKVGDDTTFAQIIELVEEAQEAKADTQKFMERFAFYYTPAIILLAALAGFITQNVHLALTFLVIACPGALVISVPVSIVAGIGNAAKNGILIKGGDKMENLAKVNAVVFDKTGTLTKGAPEITDIKTFGVSAEELLLTAAEVEVTSEHHIGKAIVRKAEEAGLETVRQPAGVEIMKGHGIKAMLATDRVYLGNKSGAEKLGIPLTPEVENYLKKRQKEGNTAVLAAVNNKIAGIISIADQIRDEAPEAIRNLRQNGIRHSVMLTGDNSEVAGAVARQLGIDRVFAELLPQDKAEKVRLCKESGTKLAMVGDGINDAPAIATADVGIAMGGTATDVTMQTADIILMSDKLDKLPYALGLARATIRNMKQNTYFALGTVILLLAGVLMDTVHLALGMLIHEISVVLVILNAVRLVRYPKFQLRFRFPAFKRRTRKKLTITNPVCSAV